MVNISFQFRSLKDCSNLEIRLNFTVNNKRQNLYAKTKIEVHKDYWSEYKNGSQFKDVYKKNQKTDLDGKLHKLKTFIEKNLPPTNRLTTAWLKNIVYEYYHPEYVAVIPNALVDYLDYYLTLKEVELKNKPGTWRKWNVIQQKLIRFKAYTGKDYTISEVDEEFKKQWIEWNESERYAPITIKKELKFIKTICYHAKTKGASVSPELFKLRAKIDEVKYPKIYLSFDELITIQNLSELPEYLDNVRDWLIISCFTGQRISDFMRFTKSMIRTANDQYFLDIEQQKTGKTVTVPLMPEVMQVLTKRNGDFPRRISDQRYNDYIKEVCELAGINQPTKGKLTQLVKVNDKNVKRDIPGVYEKYKLIGSHVGRRSFATNFYGKLPTTYIKNITGHATEQMLLEYIGKGSDDTASEAYELMLNVNRR